MRTDAILDVSVIICAYTEERWLDLVAAVESVQQQSTPPREVIVVVDYNKPLFERVRLHIPGVVAIENSQPQGLSGARNSGIVIAQGAMIAFLDDDATAEQDWLVQLSRCCENTKVLGAGGVVEPLWSSKRPVWFPEEFYWVVGCSYQHLPQMPEVVRNPYGGCICIWREVFESIGGFRNDIGRVRIRPMGCEETEFCIRARQHWPQRVFLYHPQARIQHRIPPYRASWRYFCSRCYAEGLSKAVVTRYVGVKDGLSAERTYALRTLPQGVLRGLMNGLLYFKISGFLRAGAIIAGLLITTAGYAVGTVIRFLVPSKEAKTSFHCNLKQL